MSKQILITQGPGDYRDWGKITHIKETSMVQAYLRGDFTFPFTDGTGVDAGILRQWSATSRIF